MWVSRPRHDELTMLAHRSGIGDYLDEEAEHDITEHPHAVPPQDLTGA
jgi:hypothetical protein